MSRRSEHEKRRGQPPMWESSEDFERAIAEYFARCDASYTGDDKRLWKPYTIEGLCLALGCTRATLSLYAQDHPNYFDALQKARERIAEHKISLGMVGVHNPAVTIFDLKNNHGYKDKTEQDVRSEVITREGPPATADECRDLMREVGMD